VNRDWQWLPDSPVDESPGDEILLISRELMADGIEAVVRGHSFDAFIGIAGCDKSLPGILWYGSMQPAIGISVRWKHIAWSVSKSRRDCIGRL